MSVREVLACVAFVLLGSSCRAVAGVNGELCLLEPGSPAGVGCRLVPPQCGCPEGQACIESATGRICGAPGLTPVGQPCATPLDCAGGSTCLNYGSIALCSQFCSVNDDCPSGSLCTISLVEGGTVCTLPCNPAAPADRCGPAACDFLANVTMCRVAGSSGLGGACSVPADCGVGLHCLLEIGVAACFQLCGDGISCPAGEYCQEFTSFDPVGAGRYGNCGPPPT